MFYFLLLQLFTKLKYKNQKLIFSMGTMCYLISIHLYKTMLYSLFIPIDICYTTIISYKDLIYKKGSVSNDFIKEITVNKPITSIINQTITLPEIINIKKEPSERLVNIKKNKIKYIPHKLDIKSPLQQTLRNLGI